VVKEFLWEKNKFKLIAIHNIYDIKI